MDRREIVEVYMLFLILYKMMSQFLPLFLCSRRKRPFVVLSPIHRSLPYHESRQCQRNLVLLYNSVGCTNIRQRPCTRCGAQRNGR